MKLWLVRHARPLVDEGVCYGASDVLADAVHTQACAARLAAVLPAGLALWHSPLRRCRQLATALHAARPDLRPRADARLAEMDFGCWEGVLWEAIEKRHYDAWNADFARHRFGGRESVAELMRRVRQARAEAARAGEEMAWITHAGVMRAMVLLDRGVRRIEHAEQWPREAPAWGEWLELTL